MTLSGFKAQNHPQQTAARGARDDVDDRRTRAEYFDYWDEDYGPFTLDVAASDENTKCEKYFTIETDGLSQSWADETVWCNPPYSNISAWVHKAWQQHLAARGIVMLLPANRTEQQWWQTMVEPHRDKAIGFHVNFLPGRMRFDRPNAVIGPKGDRPPFGLCLLIWDDLKSQDSEAPNA